jgi:hypothetical protein
VLDKVSLSYGRADTLYARLAGLSPQLGISLVNHVEPQEKRDAIDNDIKHRKLAPPEK